MIEIDDVIKSLGDSLSPSMLQCQTCKAEPGKPCSGGRIRWTHGDSTYHATRADSCASVSNRLGLLRVNITDIAKLASLPATTAVVLARLCFYLMMTPRKQRQMVAGLLREILS